MNSGDAATTTNESSYALRKNKTQSSCPTSQFKLFRLCDTLSFPDAPLSIVQGVNFYCQTGNVIGIECYPIPDTVKTDSCTFSQSLSIPAHQQVPMQKFELTNEVQRISHHPHLSKLRPWPLLPLLTDTSRSILCAYWSQDGIHQGRTGEYAGFDAEFRKQRTVC
jgi:hypothetical protein